VTRSARGPSLLRGERAHRRLTIGGSGHHQPVPGPRLRVGGVGGPSALPLTFGDPLIHADADLVAELCRVFTASSSQAKNM
jgi:hypothetical protein